MSNLPNKKKSTTTTTITSQKTKVNDQHTLNIYINEEEHAVEDDDMNPAMIAQRYNIPYEDPKATTTIRPSTDTSAIKSNQINSEMAKKMEDLILKMDG